MSTLGERIKIAREARSLSQEQLGALVGPVTREAVSLWETGSTRPKHGRLERIAIALTVRFDWLRADEGAMELQPALPPPDKITELVQMTAPGALPRDVRVLGVGVGGSTGDFRFNGEVIDLVRRPPGLAGAVNVFGIFIENDSMKPRFEHGDLIFVHPGRPVTPGKDVLIELHGHDGEPGDCYIKRLVRRTATKLIVEQFNPPKDIEIPWSQIRVVHRILTTAELLGI